MSLDLSWITNGLKQPGKTRAGIAKAMGVSAAQVTRILQGKRHLRAKDIETIASYLGIDVRVMLPANPDAAPDQSTRACIKAAHQTLASTDYSDAEARAVASALLETVLRNIGA